MPAHDKIINFLLFYFQSEIYFWKSTSWLPTLVFMHMHLSQFLENKAIWHATFHLTWFDQIARTITSSLPLNNLPLQWWQCELYPTLAYYNSIFDGWSNTFFPLSWINNLQNLLWSNPNTFATNNKKKICS